MEGHCWLRGFAVSGICLLLLGISGHVARGQEPESGATQAPDTPPADAGGTETGASNDTVPASIQQEVNTTAEKTTEAPAITNEVINDTAVMPPDHTVVSPQGDKVTGAQESDVTSFGVNSTAGGSEPGATKGNVESENVPVLPTTPFPAVEPAKATVNGETTAPKDETIAGGGEENTPAPNAETPSVPGEENTEVPGGEAVLSGENGTTAEPSVEQTSTGAPEITTSEDDAANSTEPAPVTDKPGLQWENETTTQQPEPSAASFETIHEKADYVIGDANNKPCLLATLNVTITVTYHVQEGPLKETYETTSAEIPRDAVTTGSCGDNDSLLTLSWANNTFTLNITFTVTDRAYNPDGDLQMDVLQQGVNSSHSWVVNQVALSYDTSDAVIFPGASERKVQTVSLKDLHLFQTPVGSSYLCQTTDALEMEAKTVHLGFNYVHFQPFGVKSDQNTRFANETVECSRDLGVVPDQQDAYTIPLIVACCLAAAVVIIIVAYASHRYVTRKLHQSQYKQME